MAAKEVGERARILKPTLGHTRLTGPSGGDATHLDLLFDSDSAAVYDCFVYISTLRANLKGQSD